MVKIVTHHLNDWSRSLRHRRKAVAALLLVAALAAVDAVLLRTPIVNESSMLHALLRDPLETRFPRPEIGNAGHLAGIIVPGGSYDRLREAGRLARQFPDLKLVVSDKRHHLRWLGDGIDPQRIILEERSQTTWENATFVAALLRSNRFKADRKKPWLLVTSSVHMPRASGAFQAAGIDIVPWPVLDPDRRYLGYKMVRHEWVGLVAYALTGRSSTLLPGPGDFAGTRLADSSR